MSHPCPSSCKDTSRGIPARCCGFTPQDGVVNSVKPLPPTRLRHFRENEVGKQGIGVGGGMDVIGKGIAADITRYGVGGGASDR